MWARRCGVPARWPSRIRVVIQSCMTGTIGLVVYEYMANLQMNNLDIGGQSPTVDYHGLPQHQVACFTYWPKRNEHGGTEFWTWSSWQKWAQFQRDPQKFADGHRCTLDGVDRCSNATTAGECRARRRRCGWHGGRCIAHLTAYEGQECTDAHVPVTRLSWSLGYPVGDGVYYGFWNDVLYVYAHLFLGLGLCNLVAFLVHDLALLHTVNKDYVLDWSGMNHGFPMLGRFPAMTGVPLAWDLFSTAGKERSPMSAICGLVFFPICLAWGIVLFLAILFPAVVVLFLLYPVRLSRFWIFILLIAMSLYGLCLAAHQILFLTFPNTRPVYAVTWKAGDECECGCSYVMSATIHQKLLLIGLGVVFQSLLSALRCLRGLRRSQWANLMSVMFPVPVGVYAVEWTQPSGDPIKNREDGQPVQGEPAFDPFALMDEQPESRFTTLTLRPQLAYNLDQGGRWKPLGIDRSIYGPEMPRTQRGEWQIQPTEYVGCCGFPCLTGGYQAVMPETDSEEPSSTEQEPLEVGVSWNLEQVREDEPKKNWRHAHHHKTSRFTLLKEREHHLAKRIVSRLKLVAKHSAAERKAERAAERAAVKAAAAAELAAAAAGTPRAARGRMGSAGPTVGHVRSGRATVAGHKPSAGAVSQRPPVMRKLSLGGERLRVDSGSGSSMVGQSKLKSIPALSFRPVRRDSISRVSSAGSSFSNEPQPSPRGSFATATSSGPHQYGPRAQTLLREDSPGALGGLQSMRRGSETFGMQPLGGYRNNPRRFNWSPQGSWEGQGGGDRPPQWQPGSASSGAAASASSAQPSGTGSVPTSPERRRRRTRRPAAHSAPAGGGEIELQGTNGNVSPWESDDSMW